MQVKGTSVADGAARLAFAEVVFALVLSAHPLPEGLSLGEARAVMSETLGAVGLDAIRSQIGQDHSCLNLFTHRSHRARQYAFRLVQEGRNV